MGLDTDTGQMLAVKQVTLAAGQSSSSRAFIEQLRSLETEISLLRPLNHPNIVRCYGCERDNDELNIFLELVPGGSITSVHSSIRPFRRLIDPSPLAQSAVACARYAFFLTGCLC